MNEFSAGRLMVLGSELVASGGLDRQVWDLGYDVVAVLDDPEEACARAGDSDLALVDWNLGRFPDGESVSRRLRNEHNLPVVMVSRAGRGDVPPCVRFPLEARELRAVLQNALIRHRVEAERRRLEQRMLAGQRTESLGAIGTQVVHDFNNVLQSMIGYVELAIMELPRSSPARAVLNRVVASGMSGAVLCRQFMLSSVTPPAGPDCVEISALVGELQPMLRSIVKKGTRIDYRLASNLPPAGVPAAELRQILFNLVLNSSDAIGVRRGELGIASGLHRFSPQDIAGFPNHASCVGEGDHVFLEVSDDGGGIRAEPVERIFEPFFTTKPSASGLGLTAVRELVRRHRGAVEVKNRAGAGATFRVYFPTAQPPAAA